MDIEAAKFRVLWDDLAHAMPIEAGVIRVTPYVDNKLNEIWKLVYLNGKRTVTEARKIVTADNESK